MCSVGSQFLFRFGGNGFGIAITWRVIRMKATINGIAVEGTPQEITSYIKLMDDLRRSGTYIKPPLGNVPEWIQKQLNSPAFIDGYKVNSQSKCPNQGGACYCTGVCK